MQSSASAEDPLLWETVFHQESACTEELHIPLPPTEDIQGSLQIAADTRSKQQPPFPFPLQENSTQTQKVFKGFIVVRPAQAVLESSLVVDKGLHVSSSLQHF